MTIKLELIEEIIVIEGGYSDDPDDSGGETNHGITEDEARAFGYVGEMKDLPHSKAVDIYSKRFWDSMRLSEIEHISEMLVRELFDTAVNQGVRRSTRFLQRSLNALNYGGNHFDDIKVDGRFGSKTMLSLKNYAERRKSDGILILLRMLNSLQGAFYVTLVERREKDEKFIYGWFRNRVS